jgi:hypothetical protein
VVDPEHPVFGMMSDFPPEVVAIAQQFWTGSAATPANSRSALDHS